MTSKRNKPSENCDWLILAFVAVALASVAASNCQTAANGSHSSQACLATGADWTPRATDALLGGDESLTVCSELGARRSMRSVRNGGVSPARALVRAPWFFSPTFSHGYRLRVVAVARAQRLFLLFLSLRN